MKQLDDLIFITSITAETMGAPAFRRNLLQQAVQPAFLSGA